MFYLYVLICCNLTFVYFFISGFIVDWTGGYTFPYLIAGILGIFSSLCFAFVSKSEILKCGEVVKNTSDTIDVKT